jgi:hypothetical protein
MSGYEDNIAMKNWTHTLSCTAAFVWQLENVKIGHPGNATIRREDEPMEWTPIEVK